MATVLVTGGTGFIGAHAIAQLLEAGHEVKTTIRSLDGRADVEHMLSVAEAPHPERVAYFAANLMHDDGWAAAAEGAEYVLHVASPFPTTQPKDADELVVPAREGALRVLRAAREAGAKRVVLTSSFAAVGYGHGPLGRPLNEVDWTNLDRGNPTPYVRSKTIAERSAWDFIDKEGGGLELSVVNPVAVLGPVLGADYSNSIRIVIALMKGWLPVAPPVWMNVVDVRDVVDLHLKAMTAPGAAGQRFIAVAGEPISFRQLGVALHEALGDAAAKPPRGTAPAWLVRALARFVPPLQELVPQLNVVRRASSAKARAELGWAPRSSREAAVATGESLVRLGILAN
ncbi:NAD-dependent epimerase/dehydratase family protein [Sinomonas gamaensis]|uniref:NAD-dependent epimerase/dehydratase family protein n=1 Tax=Sinomonas gamaensis TaxID=2565624 RepID=UPI00110812F2|nr:NAD-dependent epimerase/dehydratase family protein [Sinomonas gamaensis]